MTQSHITYRFIRSFIEGLQRCACMQEQIDRMRTQY